MYLSSLWAPSLPAAVCYDGDCWKRVERPPKESVWSWKCPTYQKVQSLYLAVLEVVVPEERENVKLNNVT